MVTNKHKKLQLFSLRSKVKPVKIPKDAIDDGNVRKVPELCSGNKLLIIQDETPWILVRLGYDNSTHKSRKDVLQIGNGKAQNKVICSYNNANSNPSAWYTEIEERENIIKNVNFIRTNESTAITNFLEVRYKCHIRIENVNILTPQTGEIDSGDSVFFIEDCADLSMNNIIINGTYSEKRKTGYGIRLMNVYDTKICRLYAKCKWGVFGNYNINKVRLKKCDLNRFDVHSYGTDIKCEGCKFHGLYNQFSSIFGTILFENCKFEDEVPFLQESSFNAFTPFDLIWRNCEFELTKRKNYLVTLFGVPEVINYRPELSAKCLPNIELSNCRIVIPNKVNKWYLIETRGGKYKGDFDYISKIKLGRVKINGNVNAEFNISDEPLQTSKQIKKIVDFRYAK